MFAVSCLRREVTFMSDSNDAMTSAQCEYDFCGTWKQRDDAMMERGIQVRKTDEGPLVERALLYLRPYSTLLQCPRVAGS